MVQLLPHERKRRRSPSMKFNEATWCWCAELMCIQWKSFVECFAHFYSFFLAKNKKNDSRKHQTVNVNNNSVSTCRSTEIVTTQNNMHLPQTLKKFFHHITFKRNGFHVNFMKTSSCIRRNINTLSPSAFSSATFSIHTTSWAWIFKISKYELSLQ